MRFGRGFNKTNHGGIMMKKVLSLMLALVMVMTALTGIALAETTEQTSENSDLSALLGQLDGLFGEGNGEGEDVDLAGLMGQLGGLFGEGDGEQADLAGLMGQLGGLFGEGDGESFDLSGLMGQLGGLFGEGDGQQADLSGLLGQLGGLFAEGDGQQADLSGLTGMIGGLFAGDKGAQEGENLFAKITKAAHGDVLLADSIEQFFGSWVLTKASLLGEEIPDSDIAESASTLLTINETAIFFGDEAIENAPPQLKDGILILGEELPVSVHLTNDGICLTLLGILDLDFVKAEKP